MKALAGLVLVALGVFAVVGVAMVSQGKIVSTGINLANNEPVLVMLLNDSIAVNYTYINESYYLATNPLGFINVTTNATYNTGYLYATNGTYLLKTGDTATGNYTFDTSTLFVDSTQHRVGIGTAAPLEKLDVSDRMRLRTGSSGKAGIWFAASTASNTFLGLETDTAGSEKLGIYQNGWALVVDSSGKVGVNTTTPGQALEVKGNINATGTLYADNFSSHSPLQLQTGGTTRVYINDTTGNIGIGTTNPSAPLDIVPSSGPALELGRISGYSNIKSSDNYLILDSNHGYAGFNTYVSDNVILAAGGGKVGIGTETPGAAGVAIMNGNVGIGTTSPGTMLDVHGNITSNQMAGSGNAFACVDSTGMLYRSATACA